MSKEELYKALKIFNREDLTYENNVFFNDFEEYMNTMKQENTIEVFMSTKDMIKYSKLEQEIKEIERLNNIINRTTKYVQSLSSKGRGCDIYEDIKQEILKELKGSDKE